MITERINIEYKMSEEIPIFGPYCEDIRRWDGKTFRLYLPWTRSFENDRVKWNMTLPAGFITDFGSIPRIGRRLWTPTGPYMTAYLVHDGLYAGELVNRAEADYILLELLEEYGACWVDRNTQYSAVRVGGGLVWLGHKPEEVAAVKSVVSWEYTKK